MRIEISWTSRLWFIASSHGCEHLYSRQAFSLRISKNLEAFEDTIFRKSLRLSVSGGIGRGIRIRIRALARSDDLRFVLSIDGTRIFQRASCASLNVRATRARSHGRNHDQDAREKKNWCCFLHSNLSPGYDENLSHRGRFVIRKPLPMRQRVGFSMHLASDVVPSLAQASVDSDRPPSNRGRATIRSCN